MQVNKADKSKLVQQLQQLLAEGADDNALLQTARQLVSLLAGTEDSAEENKPAARKRAAHTKLIEKELSFFETIREPATPKLQQTLFADTEGEENYPPETAKKKRKAPPAYLAIHDLKSAISINDRYCYINELFNGDATAYERSIHTINNFEHLKESMDWIERTLRLTYFWDEEDKTVQQFYALVKRKFA